MKKKFASKLKAALFVSTRSVAIPGMLLVGMTTLVTTTHPVHVANAFAQGQAILPQGTFEQPGINGKPSGWNIQTPEGTTLAGDAKNHWVQLRDTAVMMHFLKLSPEWTKLTVSARFKLSGYQKGPEVWHGPRVGLRFLDAKNQMVGDYPPQPEIAGNTDWVTKEVSMDIPAGATQLQIEPGLWGSKGLLEIDDIIVKASPAATAATAAQLVAPVDAALPADETKTGTKTGSWGVSFADGWSTFGWSANPEKGTNGVRSWSGTDTTFTGQGGWFSSTWTPGGGNWIPDIGRGSVAGPLNKMVQNYNVQWNGTGIIIPNGSTYTFGLKFNLADAPGWKDYDMTTSYEAYIVTHTNKVAAKAGKFIGTVTTPGDPVPYDCYVAEGYWGNKANGSDGKFIQLYAFRKENTWSGPVNVQAILKFWEEKSGTSLKMSTWYMSTGMTIAPETFDTAGAFRLENIRIPALNTLLPLPKPTPKPTPRARR
jgi:hypothetical protein